MVLVERWHQGQERVMREKKRRMKATVWVRLLLLPLVLYEQQQQQQQQQQR